MENYKNCFLICFLVIFAFFSFYVGVRGPFLLDDVVNLSPAGRYGGVSDLSTLVHFLFGSEGDSWSRSFSRLTFLLDDNSWPSRPEYFKLTNILFHLINGLFVYLVVIRSLILLGWKNTRMYALIAAALWTLNPSQVSTVLYVVQRMTILSATFSLAAIYLSLLTFSVNTNRKRIVCSYFVVIFLFLGVASKENGILTLPFLMVIFCLCRNLMEDGWFKRLYFFGLVAGVILFFLLFLLVSINLYSDYEFRSFSMFERFSIQAYILFKYIAYWVFPWLDGRGLFHDDMEYLVDTSNVYFFLLLWLPHLALIYYAIKKAASCQLLCLGVALFYLAHLIESTILPLELMFEHRNYFPSLGLAMLMLVFLRGAHKYLLTLSLEKLFPLFVILILGLNGIFTFKESAIWNDKKMLLPKWASEHPNSLRASYSFSQLLLNAGLYEAGLNEMRDAKDKFSDLGLHLELVRLLCVTGLPKKLGDDIDVKNIRNYEFRTNIVHSVDMFLTFDDEVCLEGFLLNGNKDDLMREVGEIAGLRKRDVFYASYWDVILKEYMQEKNYSRSVVAVEELFKVQPTIPTAMKASRLFVSGGDYENSLLYYDIAKDLSERRWYEDSGYRQELVVLKGMIDQIGAGVK